MNGIKINENETVYPIEPITVYIDNIHMYFSTGLSNQYIIFSEPFPKDEKLKVSFNMYQANAFKIGLFSKNGDTFTLESEQTYSKSEIQERMTTKNYSETVVGDTNARTLNFEVEMKKGYYLGYFGCVCSNKTQADSDFVVSPLCWNVTLSNNKATVEGSGNQRDIAIKIENIPNDISRRLNRGANGFYNYPEDTKGYHFFRVTPNSYLVDYDKTDTTEMYDSEKYSLTNGVLYLPKTYSPTGAPTPIIMWCHGWQKFVGTNVTGSSLFQNRTPWAEARGYAVFDVDGGYNMGGMSAVWAYAEAYRYIREHFNVEHQCFVHGESMGGFTSLNFVNHYPNMVKACCEFFPGIDLYNQGYLADWSGSLEQNKAKVASNYGFEDTTGATWEADKVISWNPIDAHTVTSGDKRYTLFPVPLLILHGTADGTMPIRYSEQYVEQIRNAGGMAWLHKYNGMGHSLNENFYKEQIMFFDRFR